MTDISLLRWFADEALLHHALEGLSTAALLAIVALCIAVLSKGADTMIEGVVALAQRTGMPKIVIGATIVSLGTTAPEAFVSVMAAFMGNAGLALGNGVGSIIADTGLIFGLTCVLATVPINRFILDRTGWVQVGAATLLVAVSIGIALLGSGPPRLTREVGLFFLALLVLYLYMAYRWARQGGATAMAAGPAAEDGHGVQMGLVRCWAMVAGGLAMVVLSARVLVPAASLVARRFGVPEDVIAATMVAFGTSLPELMTALTAVRKGHPEITVGNIVGADVLNCLFVIGAAATARPLSVPPSFFTFHFPAMLVILFSFRAFISFNRTGRFHKWQGVWLLSVYAVYVVGQYAMNLHID